MAFKTWKKQEQQQAHHSYYGVDGFSHLAMATDQSSTRLLNFFIGVYKKLSTLNFTGLHKGGGGNCANITHGSDDVSDRGTPTSLEIFTQSSFHHAKTRGPGRGSRSSLSVVIAHTFNWPPICLSQVRGGVDKEGL